MNLQPISTYVHNEDEGGCHNVLVFHKEYGYVVAHYEPFFKMWYLNATDSEWYVSSPTHWCELPEKP